MAVKTFEAQTVAIPNATITPTVTSLNSDPTAGGGVAAPLGSFLMRTDNGTVYVKTGAPNTSWTAIPLTAPVASSFGVFGTGADGAQHFDGAATILGMAPVANVYTLTRDLLLSSGTIDAGVSIDASGFRIFCTGTLQGPGKITSNGKTGGAGSGGTGGLGGAGAFIPSATKFFAVGVDPVGGVGGVGSGPAGPGNQTNQMDGFVGTGGASIPFGSPGVGNPGTGFGAGGSGGSAVSASASGGNSAAFTGGGGTARNFESIGLWLNTVSSPARMCGVSSGGGGGGGSGGAQGGGGGGGGAGIVWIAAQTLTNITLEAKGGDGGVGPGASASGGGGGGGGRVVKIRGTESTVTTTITGGNGGAGGVGGFVGGVGAPGEVITLG